MKQLKPYLTAIGTIFGTALGTGLTYAAANYVEANNLQQQLGVLKEAGILTIYGFSVGFAQWVVKLIAVKQGVEPAQIKS